MFRLAPGSLESVQNRGQWLYNGISDGERYTAKGHLRPRQVLASSFNWSWGDRLRGFAGGMTHLNEVEEGKADPHLSCILTTCGKRIDRI